MNSGIRLLTKVFLTNTDAVGLRPNWLPRRTNFTVTPAQTSSATVTYGLEDLEFRVLAGARDLLSRTPRPALVPVGHQLNGYTGAAVSKPLLTITTTAAARRSKFLCVP